MAAISCSHEAMPAFSMETHGIPEHIRSDHGPEMLIEQSRVFYHTERPHSSLGYRPQAPEALLTDQEISMQKNAA